MSKPFDATLKQLVDRYAADWAGFVAGQAGLPPGAPLEPLDADLSTVSPQADKLFRVGTSDGGLVHLEVQSSWEAGVPDRAHLYNTLAHHRYGGPVRSVVLLLRPEANTSELTGTLTRGDEAGEYLRFRYRVVRLWQQTADALVGGPPGLLPLALLTDDAAGRLDRLLRAVDARLEATPLPPGGHAELLTACQLLLGLRYDIDVVRALFGGLRMLRESSGYQLILEEGRAEGLSLGLTQGLTQGLAQGRAEGELQGLREAVLDAATERLGPPPADAAARLAAAADRDHLRRLARRAGTAADWDDLLATP